MRHLVFGRKLGRDTNARRALLANLASSLFINGAIITTLVKAKFARPYVEKLVRTVQKNRLSSKRSLASVLTHQAFLKLIAEIGPGFTNRSGGYTRIIKLGARVGDNAPIARLELLEWEKGITEGRPQKAQKKDHRKHRNSVSTVIKKQSKSVNRSRKRK